MKPRATRQRGFTLVEILVVMVLLALLMLGMGSALHSAAQTETRVDARLARLDHVRTVSQFLRTVLGQVTVRNWTHPELPPGTPFKGVRADAGRIEWAGIMPARHGVGGPHFFRLALEDDAQGVPALVLRYAPWPPGVVPNDFPDWSGATARVLVEHATHFTVQAKGDWPQGASAGTWPQGWQAGWPVPDAAPGQVLLDIADDQGEWPLLAVALRANRVTTSENFSVGGEEVDE